jgi:two-component system, NarL family, sensor kinase
MLILSGSFPAERVFSAIPPVKQGNRTLKDSLLILDTLVGMNKVSNPSLSVLYAKKAMVIAHLINTDEAKSRAYQLMGIAYFHNRKDSSNYYYTLAIHVADDAGLTARMTTILYNLSFIYDAAGDKRKAIQLLDSAIRLSISVGDYEIISNAYNAIGTIRRENHDYENAKLMFDSAFKVAERKSLYKQMGASLANIARFEDDTSEAISRYEDALHYFRKIKDGKGAEAEMATILVNIGNKYKNPDSALFYYKKALKLAINANLSMNIMIAYNNMAYSYLDKGDIQMAETCLKDHAIPIAVKEKDLDWLSSLHDTYADVAIAQKDYRKAYEMEKKSYIEREADNKNKAAAQVRLLASILDLKNKELMIREAEARVQKIRFWLIVSTLLAFALVFAIVFLQQRSRARLQKEQIGSARRIIEMEESEKGRIARELHDLTGQLVMGISGTIENIEFPEPEIKEMIKNNISRLGKSIRQISHRMNRAMIEHFTFSELITGLCEDVKRLSGLSVNLDMPEEFPDLPNELVLHFYRITQELLTNATKYARDSDVLIEIIPENDRLILHYSDNGPGFNTAEKTRSMGIINIHERAKLIRGRATLKSGPGQGTSWEIVFPLQSKNILTG